MKFTRFSLLVISLTQLLFLSAAVRGDEATDVLSCHGCFIGEFHLSANPADPSGGTRILDNDYFFIDPQGLVWKANKGDITDGASIPPIFQPVIGGPWEDDYLPPAVLHDHYTNDAHKVRTWRSTDFMFFQAMMVRHTDVIKAKTMYYAVYVFGPHWDKLSSGVNCGQNCVNAAGGQTFRPSNYAAFHSAELGEVSEKIRNAELSGQPLSLSDLRGIAISKHPQDVFITTEGGNVIQ